MLTAIKSIILIILAIIGLVISFFIGVFLLIRGILKKPLAEYAGTNVPRNLMITGIVLISLPFAATAVLAISGITLSATTIYQRSNYECIPDVWRHETVSRGRAEDDIITALLSSADKGNRESFAKNFTPQMQKKNGFDDAVDKFFGAYPTGLSKCEKYDKVRMDQDEAAQLEGIKEDSLSFRCCLDENWYFLMVEYCYRNDEEPDKVGVTGFRVMNLEAAAVYYENEDANVPARFPVCDIKSSSEVNARMIAGNPYLWKDTDTPRISEDQLREILKKTNRLDSPILKYNIGEPNLIIKEPDSNEYGYFFELTSSSEPRYAYFQTDSERGNILWALLCTPYEIDYKRTFVEYEENR